MNSLNISTKAPVTFENIETSEKMGSEKAVHKSDSNEKLDRLAKDTGEVSSKVLPDINKYLILDHFRIEKVEVQPKPSKLELVKKTLEQNTVQTTEPDLKSKQPLSQQEERELSQSTIAALLERMDVMDNMYKSVINMMNVNKEEQNSNILELKSNIVELKSKNLIQELELNRFKDLGSYEELEKSVNKENIVIYRGSGTPIFGYGDGCDIGMKFLSALPVMSTLSGIRNIAEGACGETSSERKVLRVIRGIMEAGIITSILLLPIDLAATWINKKTL